MTEETVAWSDAKDAVRAAVGFHEKQKARKSVTMVGRAVSANGELWSG